MGNFVVCKLHLSKVDKKLHGSDAKDTLLMYNTWLLWYSNFKYLGAYFGVSY